MNNLRNLAIFALTIASTLSIFLSYSFLNEHSKQVNDNFLKTNSHEFAIADVASLAVKLNGLSSSARLDRIFAKKGNTVFYQHDEKDFFSFLGIEQEIAINDIIVRINVRLPQYFERGFIVLFFILLSAMLLIMILSTNAQKEKDRLKNLHLEHLSTLSTQVAHDIRSPLAALDSIYQDLDKMDPSKSTLIKSALSRIHAIADGLLTSARTGDYTILALEDVILADLIDEIVAEKRMQFSKHSGLTLSTSNTSTNSTVKANRTEVARILSNLINNSAEAMNYRGDITLKLSQEAEELCLSIIDQGPGIPSSIIETLGTKGITHGKEKGNGLGLYHAFTRMKDFSGQLQILSSKQGTSINLHFPHQTCHGVKLKKIVLVDNDPLVRLNWSIAAKQNEIELITFSSSKELMNGLAALDLSTPIYIDDDLGEEQRGFELAEKLNQQGFQKLHLCTGHEPEQFSHLSYLHSVSGKNFPKIL